MEWLRISTSTELVRVATDEILYVRADGNYSDLVLISGRSRKMTFQIHFFDDIFQQLQNNVFVRVGRSLIVNKRYIYVINLTEQLLILYGGNMPQPVEFYGLPSPGRQRDITISRDALKQLKESLENERGGDYE